MGISFDDEGQATEDYRTDFGGPPNAGYGVTQTAVPETPETPEVPEVPADTGNGNEAIDWDNAWWRKDLAGEWNAPERPGSFGSVGSGGPGGAGQVADVGDFTFDQYDYNPYGGPQMTAETYSANPLAQNYQYADFDTPVDVVDFREFQAPTQEQAMADQGYQFRLAEGQRALENSAAAKGMLRSGNTWKDLMNYGQGAASQEYDKVYGRRRGEHGMAYQQALQANQDEYGRATQQWQMNRQNQADMYGRALTDDQRRMQAQQLSEQSRFGAHSANLGMHQANEAMRSGAWDRNYMGGQAQYDYRLRRAEHEASMAEAAAGRSMSASAANASAAERAYSTEYNRARQEYLDAYNINREQTADRWKRDRYWDQFAVMD